MSEVQASPFDAKGFHHEAFLYTADDEFLAGLTTFIRDGVDAGETVHVLLPEPRLGLLRAALGVALANVTFVDVRTVGQNPARLMSVWQDLINRDGSVGRPVRGIGETIFGGRTPDEVVECQIHEALINVGFTGADALTILCPYDRATLDPSIHHEAQRTHPWIHHDGARSQSTRFAGVPDHAAIFGQRLQPAPPDAHSTTFAAGDERRLRRLVSAAAADAGVADDRADDLVLAVSEIAANSIRHGGGSGVLTTWLTDSGVICEVADRGRIEHLLAGRLRPARDQLGGRGLWLTNQLCDLVQIRVGPEGNIVRIHQHASNSRR